MEVMTAIDQALSGVVQDDAEDTYRVSPKTRVG